MRINENDIAIYVGSQNIQECPNDSLHKQATPTNH